MTEPDLISVTAQHRTEVDAHEVELHVTVQGSSLVTGRAAFEKAKEVARLVEALARVGVARDAFQLRSVRAEVTSGLLGRSSSATYELSIRCTDLEVLPDVLGEISAAKQATLDFLEWHYADDASQKARWLARCVADANIKAQAIAAALPARILGVHSVREVDPAAAPSAYESAPGAAGGGMLRSRSSTVALGFPLGQSRTVTTVILAAYRIGPLA